MPQVQMPEELCRPRFSLVAAQPVKRSAHLQMLPDRQRAKERVVFGQRADLAFERDVLDGYRLAGDHYLSRCRRQQAGHQLHGGCIARTVRPQKAEDRPARYPKIQVVYRGEGAELFGQTPRFNVPGFHFVGTQFFAFAPTKFCIQCLCERLQNNTICDLLTLHFRRNLMNVLLQDLRYGARMSLKNPGFSLIATLTLALGIGANTAIFSVVNAVLLKPLPFKEPERLVMVWNRGAEAAGGDRTPLAVADLLDWRAQSRSFAEIGAFQNIMYNYTGGDSPERVQAAGVTANFFSMLGAPAQLGRAFSPDEEGPGARRVAVLRHGFGRKHCASGPRVLGRTINLNGDGFTVIGVMPAALDFPSKWVELWTALQLEQPTRRGPYFLTGVARLKPGVRLDQARAEALNALKSSFQGELDLNALPVNEFIVGDTRLALLVLMGAVTLVLLIAAVNVANLTLVRSAGRVKEISIRAALGASRVRIIRQLLTESMLLALAGGLLGALWSSWGVKLLLKMAPENIPRLNQIGIDGRALVWTALLSMLTGAIFGLAPAWQSSRLSLNETLKEGGRSGAESPGKRRWRDLLV